MEFEADTGYPGAPGSRGAAGGNTPRRLLYACTRYPGLREVMTGKAIGGVVARLIGSRRVLLSQNHHNCVMTKHPGFSSLTNWHQDIRYWRFDRPELVSVWLSLGDETPENGALSIISGSHRMDVARGRLDASLFLRTDLAENHPMIAAAVPADLHPGDVLFFHSRVFHAAGRNQTDRVKLSPVFTYRADDNRPIPETRSALHQDLPVASDDTKADR